MNRLLVALTSPFHVTVLLIGVVASLAAFLSEAMGWADPDYRKLCFVIVLGYLVGVLIELGAFARDNRTS